VLNCLPIVADAPFNAYQRQHDPTCLPDTRVDLLQEIYSWADGRDERCIFWLSGLAGTGKSTIARTVARQYFDQKRLGASFFFSRGGGDVGHAGKFITSIAWQIANNIPSLHQHIYNALTECRDIANQSLRDQWQQLVLQPLLQLGENSGPFSYVVVVVIDALDECDNDNHIRIIIHLLAEARSLKAVRLRVLLTSRPEIPIRYKFHQIAEAEHQDFVLHNIAPSIVDHDISIFLEYHLKLVGQEHLLDACWPDEEIIRRLVQTAGGLFIWAATACRFIQEGRRFAARRVDTILRGSGSAPTAPEKHLDEIYTTVLKQSVAVEYTDEEKEEVYNALRKALGSIAILLSPLPASLLSKLLGIKKEAFYQTLNDLHSVLDIPKNQSQPLRLHHPSFRDYLLSKSRCQDPDFWVDEKQTHQMLADSCLRLLSTSLKQDICGLDAPGMLVAEVERSMIEQNLPPEVQYACLYWVQHIQMSGVPLYDDGQVHCFLQEHLLYWLEALGWMRKVSEGVYALAALESLATVSIYNII
jgi:NACHT domain